MFAIEPARADDFCIVRPMSQTDFVVLNARQRASSLSAAAEDAAWVDLHFCTQQPMRIGRTGGPKTPGEDPPAVATGHLGHLAGCSDVDTRGPHLLGAQGPALHWIFLHESGGYGAPPCCENLRTMTSSSAQGSLGLCTQLCWQGRLADARKRRKWPPATLPGARKHSTCSGLLEMVLVF